MAVDLNITVCSGCGKKLMPPLVRHPRTEFRHGVEVLQVWEAPTDLQLHRIWCQQHRLSINGVSYVLWKAANRPYMLGDTVGGFGITFHCLTETEYAEWNAQQATALAP